MDKDELLIELSNLFDVKLGGLEKRLELKIETEVSRLDQKIDSTALRLDTRITSLEENLDTRITSLEEKVDTNITRLDASISRLDQKIDSTASRLETEIRHRDLLIENEVIPRLKNLEECYTSTSYRYQEGVVKLDSLDEDVTIMKRVITDHSNRLNALEQSVTSA